jgi:hypothetical protein
MCKFAFMTIKEPLKAEGHNLAGSCKFSSAMAYAVLKIYLQIYSFICIRFYKQERLGHCQYSTDSVSTPPATGQTCSKPNTATSQEESKNTIEQ